MPHRDHSSLETKDILKSLRVHGDPLSTYIIEIEPKQKPKYRWREEDSLSDFSAMSSERNIMTPEQNTMDLPK